MKRQPDSLNRQLNPVSRVLAFPVLILIRLYQLTVSRALGPVCRYYPSCSHYGYTAFRIHGVAVGSVLTAWRIMRCHPWASGGIDRVPERGSVVNYLCDRDDRDHRVQISTQLRGA